MKMRNLSQFLSSLKHEIYDDVLEVLQSSFLQWPSTPHPETSVCVLCSNLKRTSLW
jgi:hypothetical protein